MKIRLFGKEIEIKATIVQSLPKIYDDEAWKAYLSGKGYAVTPSTALKVAVALRCADVVAKTMATLGCHLYKQADDGKTRAYTHRLYSLLRYMPNPETTAYEFWHMYVFSLMLSKGAFAKIVRDQNGFIKELWNIPSANVRLDRNKETGERYIEIYLKDGKRERIYEGGFMYTPGLRFSDSDNPEDFIKIASEVLGLTMSLNGYAKDFFENGSNLGGFIEYPNAIDHEAFTKFKEDWGKTYSGVMNQHKWALLEGGFKVTKMDSNPEQAQALESRKFQIEEVCRLMGVPPHKVFMLDRMTFNNVEQINIEYVQETLDPMSERLEQTIYKDLLTTAEQRRFFSKFNTNKLLKGDIQSRTTYYNQMRQNGVFNANDIRDLEDMNLISAEEGGNAYLVNGNMISMKNAEKNLPKSMQKGDSKNGQ